MKKWDVNVKIYGIPEDEYEQFLVDLEELVQDKGLVLTLGLGEESEDD
jgi:hypothetical protein